MEGRHEKEEEEEIQEQEKEKNREDEEEVQKEDDEEEEEEQQQEMFTHNRDSDISPFSVSDPFRAQLAHAAVKAGGSTAVAGLVCPISDALDTKPIDRGFIVD
jgi:predicted ATP-binding protein involved in virulence